jgi:hypothetical protein
MKKSRTRAVLTMMNGAQGPRKDQSVNQSIIETDILVNIHVIHHVYFAKIILGAISPSDFARHSTRSRKVTNYNEDNAELWGLSDDDTAAGESYTPAPAEEDEGEVIEAVLDHRKCEGHGKLVYLCLESLANQIH